MNIWNAKSLGSLSDLTDDFSNVSVETFPPLLYEVKCTPYTFQASVQKDSLNECDRISFGGKKICVQIYVYWDDNEHMYPQLDGVSYNDNCTLTEDFKLERKHGTVRMLKTALKFLAMLYPKINGVLFRDTSFMKCVNDIKLNLSEFYIAKHGKTWYQEKFGAEPYDNEFYFQNLKTLNNKLDAPKSLTFEDFYNQYILINKIRMRQKFKAIKEVYDESTTYREFVKHLHNKSSDCIVFNKWLSYFISKQGGAELNLQNAFFIIKAEIINGWSENISFRVVTNNI